MKLLLALILLFLAAAPAHAAPEGPLSLYFPSADSVYLVRVVSVDKNTVTFSVTEALRGAPVATLTLTAREVTFKKDTEWMLLSAPGWRDGQDKDVVGDFMEGRCGWIFAGVKRDGATTYVAGGALENGKFTGDKVDEAGGQSWLTLGHFKHLLNTTPLKTTSN